MLRHRLRAEHRAQACGALPFVRRQAGPRPKPPREPQCSGSSKFSLPPRQRAHHTHPLPRPHRHTTDGLWPVLAPPPKKNHSFFVSAVDLLAQKQKAKKGEKSIESGNLDARCVSRRAAPPPGANSPPRARVMPLSLVVSASPNFHRDSSACFLCVLFSLRAPLLRVPAFVSSAWHFRAGKAGRPGLPSLALLASCPPAVCRCRWCRS